MTVRTADAERMPGGGFTHQQILRVIFGILLCILLGAVDQTVVVPAVPAIAAELRGFGHLSWIVSAYLLTSTAATPIYGRLSDLYGRRALLLPAIAVFAVASVLCALAQSLAQLIVWRALQGLGGAGLMAMSQAAIADVVSPRERGRYQGYMAGVWGFASIAGPVVGGYVTDHLSWRWIFWVNLPLSIVAMIQCNQALKLLPVRRVRARIDYGGAALLTGAVASWLVVLSSGGTEVPWNSGAIYFLTALGAALLGILAWQERRIAEPLLPPRIFANGVITRGVMIAFCASLVLFGSIFLLPLMFQLVRGADAGQSGFLVTPFLGTNAVGAYIAGSLTRRIGRNKPFVLIGLFMCLVGFGLLAIATAATPWTLLLFEQVMVGAGIGMLMPTSLVVVQNAAERRDVGVVTGCLLFLRAMGGAFGSTLVGALLANRFAHAVAQRGLRVPLDFTTIRNGGGAASGFTPEIQVAVRDALTSGFHLAFAACGAVMLVALLITLGLQDLPLRTTALEEPQVAGH
ncbi:MAG: MFS transporter [Acetobacteraceae bacterium]|nr:MFS transporter [Acetobacteraceae bacterium]